MNDIPVEILSTEEREDGVYVHGRVDAGLPPLSRDEMNDILEREGLSVRVRDRDENPASLQAEFAYDQIPPASIFGSYHKVETVRGPSRDRSLSGKARRKARKGH